MAVVSIENFPDELYARLSKRAKQNGRVVGDEIIEAAQRLVDAARGGMSGSEKLALADQIRANTSSAWIDDELINRARHEGRS